MSTSVPFVGAGFSLRSVSPTTGRVRVAFTQIPLQASTANTNDGLRPQNYTVTGPTVASVASVSTVSGDPNSLDVVFVAPLDAGVWLLSVANIQTPGGTSLSAPTSMTFTVTDVANVTELTAGAEQDDAARIIRKHLGPAMAGPNWDALIEALAQGDDINWDNAQLAFDQLFKVTASGKYLDRLAANDGLSRPANVGMGDELFRQLATRLTTNKITHEALREILEVFYGQDALRAYAETELEEPFVLSEGQTLDWTLDETTSFRYTVESSHFGLPSSAKALEIASVLTKVMQDAGSPGFASVVVKPETGNKRVRIYSGSLGLKSFVRVTGGTTQPLLRFPTYLETYTGAVTTLGWVFSKPTQNTTRMSLTTVGQPVIDISGVETGDYMVVGPVAFPLVAASYPVLGASFSWSGGNLTQIVDIDADLGLTGSFTQDSADDLRFFRPTKRTILAGERTVVVAQTVPGTINIQIPATTQAVSRTARTGAYGRAQEAVEIKRYYRDSQGHLLIELESAITAPSAGARVIVEDATPAAARPWVSKGTPGTSPAVGTSDASFGTTWSETQAAPSQTLEGANGLKLGTGDFLLAGGSNLIASTPAASVACNRFRLVSTALVTDASEAQGATRRTYQWIATANMGTARWRHGLSLLNDGRALAAGGMSAAGVHTSTSELYDPTANTWTAMPAMATARAYHQQITLTTGQVLAIGGSTAAGPGAATALVDIFSPSTLTWTAGPAMTQARQGHRALRLPDGRIFVTGGFSVYPATVAGLVNTTEFYNPTTNTWSPGPPMQYARGYHQLVALADGRVLAFGGNGKQVDKPNPSSLTTSRQTTSEIWDPATNRWYSGPSSNAAWVECGTALLNGHVFVAGAGTGTVEYLELNEMKWKTHFLKDTAGRDRLWDLGGLGLMSGGNDGTNSYDNVDLLIPGSDAVSGGGLNGIHEVVSSTSTIVTLKTPSYPFYSSNTGDPTGGGTSWNSTTQTYTSVASNLYPIASFQRASNITTATLAGSATTTGLVVGQRVFVNINGTGFTPGFQTITGLTSTTLTYADPGANLGPSSLSGNVSIDQNPAATLTLGAAEARPSTDPGPYIFDPDSGTPVTGTTTTTTIALQKSLQYDRLNLTSVVDFPDSVGYIVLAFGTASQSKPIRYLEKIGSNLLLLDYGYVVENDYPVGTTVTLLNGRSAFVPESALDSANLYITGSTAGRIAAQASTEAAAAAGIVLDFDVVYPGDRGLGGEGYPTEGEGKLSDAVIVWGGDNLDGDQ